MRVTNPAVNIELLGINEKNQGAYNVLATSGRTLPWLQDTIVNSAWDIWNVTYRDVRVLDSQNRLYGVFNLTSHDLRYATNSAALKQLLLEAARFVDTDADQLGDDWEMLTFGNLSASARDDSDLDGQDNFAEYAFGTDPASAASKPSFQTVLAGSGTSRIFALTFRRRAGSCIDYVIDTSSNVSPWIPTPSNPDLIEPFRNLFDGTGTGLTTCTVPAPLQGKHFLRVRALPGAGP